MSRRRRLPRQLGLQFVIGLCLMCIIGVAYVVTPELFVDEPPATRTPAPIREDAEGDWFRLFFTQPELTAGLDAPTGGIPDVVAETIAEAEQTVDIAIYEFDLMPLAEAVLAAYERGVRVRVVTDTDSWEEGPIQDLRAAGIPVAADERSAIMHNKFVVLDEAAVWTGSMNFTRNDAYRNNNSFMYLRSTRLAENYTREFEEMFTDGAFGPTSPDDTPNPVVTLDGTRIENYFSPEDGVAARVLDQLERADDSIYFMAFSFTRADMAQVLLDKAAEGADVRGVFETRQIAAGGDQAWLLLTEGGLADGVRQDGNRFNLHSKVFIVDRAVVVMGSYNFSNNAEDSNDENVLIIHHPEIADAYFAEWERVWAEAGQ